jgi:hypothetical protein
VIGTLLTAVLAAPLAPVRGVLWLAENLAAHAALSSDPQAAARRRLTELAAAVGAGDLDEQSAAQYEDELLAHVVAQAGGSWSAS